MPYEVRARPYSETSAACAAAVAFDDAPRVLTPTQFDDDEEEDDDDSRDGAATPPPPPPPGRERQCRRRAGGTLRWKTTARGRWHGVSGCREGDEAALAAVARPRCLQATGPPVNAATSRLSDPTHRG